MSKLIMKSVTELQHKRRINPEQAEHITELILAKLPGERKIKPFQQELVFSTDDQHKTHVLKIFTVASSFMDQNELRKLDSDCDHNLRKLKSACSTLHNLTIKDAFIVQGDDDYEKRGQASKIL